MLEIWGCPTYPTKSAQGAHDRLCEVCAFLFYIFTRGKMHADDYLSGQRLTRIKQGISLELINYAFWHAYSLTIIVILAHDHRTSSWLTLAKLCNVHRLTVNWLITTKTPSSLVLHALLTSAHYQLSICYETSTSSEVVRLSISTNPTPRDMSHCLIWFIFEVIR
jgi:hypothetical protein